jgi:hypothetical protein
MNTILVHMADPHWTERALHFACAMAWEHNARLVLLRLLPVPYPGWLGTDLGEYSPTGHNAALLARYAALAKDYGVDFTIQPMQYITLEGALVDAADLCDALVVVAQPHTSIIPYWGKLRWWSLERRLAAQKRQLYTLGQLIDRANRTPS